MTAAAKPFVVWFTGLSGAGKWTLSHLVADELEARGLLVELLDGDAVRRHLSSELGFSKEHRDLNIERIGWVASRLVRAGAVVVVAAISPYREARRKARGLVEKQGAFVEVHVATPIEDACPATPRVCTRARSRGRCRPHRRRRSVRGARGSRGARRHHRALP